MGPQLRKPALGSSFFISAAVRDAIRLCGKIPKMIPGAASNRTPLRVDDWRFTVDGGLAHRAIFP